MSAKHKPWHEFGFFAGLRYGGRLGRPLSRFAQSIRGGRIAHVSLARPAFKALRQPELGCRLPTGISLVLWVVYRSGFSGQVDGLNIRLPFG